MREATIRQPSSSACEIGPDADCPTSRYGKHDRVAHRHAGKKLGFGLRAHEMDAVGQVLRMPSEQLGQAPVGLDHQPRRALRGEFAELVVQRRVDKAMLEQLADIRVPLLPRGDLLRMDAAKDQQMMVFRQMLQRLNGGSDAFVFVDETENPDQHRVGRQRVEHRKLAARGAAAQRLDLVQRQIGERVIEHVSDAVEVADIVAITPVMDDRADLLVALNPPELPRDAVRQADAPGGSSACMLRRRLEPERRERFGKGRRVE